MKKIGRNSRCPCGSGKKYKSCCAGKELQKVDPTTDPVRTRFEPGSYGGRSSYFPSLMSYRETGPEKWEEYFCLVKHDECFENEDDATAMATKHLDEAFEGSRVSKNADHVATSLEKKGYVSVEDFRIAKD